MRRQPWIDVVMLFALAGLLGCVRLGAGPTATPTPTPTPSAPPTDTPTALPTATSSLTPTPRPPTATRSAPPPTATSSPTALPAATTPSPTEWPAYDDRTSPTSLLASYVNAINRQAYERAWSYWEGPPNPSFEDFVQGYSNTVSVRLAVRPPTWFEGAAGSSYAEVPTLLSATHTDGSQHHVVGCFVARRPNVGPPDDEAAWSLFQAELQPTPNNEDDAQLLREVCSSTPETAYDDRSGAVSVLASCVNAINRDDYERAWAYWGTPPEPDFDAFVEGFAETASVMLVVRPPTRYEGAAGSVYVSIPTLLLARHTDGTMHAFVACYAGRRPNLGGPEVEKLWSLYDARVEPAPSNATDVALLNQACADW